MELGSITEGINTWERIPWRDVRGRWITMKGWCDGSILRVDRLFITTKEAKGFGFMCMNGSQGQIYRWGLDDECIIVPTEYVNLRLKQSGLEPISIEYFEIFN
jgi:hypothetical protein